MYIENFTSMFHPGPCDNAGVAINDTVGGPHGVAWINSLCVASTMESAQEHSLIVDGCDRSAVSRSAPWRAPWTTDSVRDLVYNKLDKLLFGDWRMRWCTALYEEPSQVVTGFAGLLELHEFRPWSEARIEMLSFVLLSDRPLASLESCVNAMRAVDATRTHARSAWLRAAIERASAEANHGMLFLGFASNAADEDGSTPRFLSCMMPIGRRMYASSFSDYPHQDVTGHGGRSTMRFEIRAHESYDIFDTDYGFWSMMWSSKFMCRNNIGADPEVTRWICINTKHSFSDLMLAFAMVMHHRLGQDSIFHKLEPGLIEIIARQWTHPVWTTENMIRYVGYSCGMHGMSNILVP